MIGSMYGTARPHVDIPRLIALYQRGQLKLDELVTRSYPLAEVNEAFEALGPRPGRAQRADARLRSRPMKIGALECLHADAGQRNFDFLKVTTDDGLVGWSEYNEMLRRPGRDRRDRAARAGRDRQGPARLRGEHGADAGAAPQAQRRHGAAGDRRDRERAARHQGEGARHPGLRAVRRPGARRASGSYWSHCGTYRAGPRASRAAACRPCARSTTSSRWAGRSSRRAISALKTNIFLLDGKPARPRARLRPRRQLPRAQSRAHVLDAIRDQLAAFREGAGPDMDILVDLNFNYKTEGYLQDGPRDGAVRPVLGRDRHARPGGAALHPRGHDDPGRLLRVPVRAARVPAVLRAAARSTSRSSTRPGTASPSRSRSPRWRTPTRSTSRRTTSTATWRR